MKNDNLSYIRVPFLTSALIMGVSVFGQMLLAQYGVKGLYKRLLWGIGGISVSIMIILAAVAFAFNIVKKEQSIIKRIFIALMFPIVAIFIFNFSFKYVYSAASDLITRNTEDIIIKNYNVEKKNAGRAGTIYSITGYDFNDQEVSFDISSGTYYSIKENAKENIKIICYEKSGVVYDIYSFE